MFPRYYLAAAYAVAMAIAALRTASADDLASCAAIDDSSARLACYDRLAGRQVPPGPGKWHLDQYHSPLSGGEVITITLRAEQADAAALAPWMLPLFIISCDNSVTQVTIAPQQRLSTSNQQMEVVLRVDGGDQTREVWQISEDSLRAFRPDPVPWIKTLLDATQLQVGLRPYLDKPLDITFNVEGLATAAQPLAKACDW
jgi:type VI secretion system VasI family protein